VTRYIRYVYVEMYWCIVSQDEDGNLDKGDGGRGESIAALSKKFGDVEKMKSSSSRRGGQQSEL
jgi:hypothetical protein